MRLLILVCALLGRASLAATATVAAYCPCARCCGVAGRPAANGRPPVAGVTIAGPRALPFGTRVWIEGIGLRIITDRSALRFDDRFDLFVPDHETAKRFGLKQLRVTILK